MPRHSPHLPFILVTLAASLAATAPARAAEEPVRRGPAEIHDEHVLAQPRLTLPAVSTSTTPAGRWAFGTTVLWSNSFAWDQDYPGEVSGERRYLIDAETLTFDATVRRGLAQNLDVALRVPFRWRGGGTLDGLIDWWHRLGHFPDGNRPDFRRDEFRVEGLTHDGAPFSWTEHDGFGLGNAEVETRWRAVDQGAAAASLALVGRAALPTGTGPFAGNGPGAGLQAVLAVPLGARFDIYTGAGSTVQGPGPVRGVEYETLRWHGFAAVEWRPWRSVSFVAETDAATRLVANIARYPGKHWMLNLAGRIDLGARTRLDLGFTENLMDQRSTTDFALYAAFSLRP